MRASRSTPLSEESTRPFSPTTFQRGVPGRAQVVGERRAQRSADLDRVVLDADHVLVGRRAEQRRETAHGPLAGGAAPSREPDRRRQQLRDAQLGPPRRRGGDRGGGGHGAQRDAIAAGERRRGDRAQRLGGVEADAGLGGDGDRGAARLEHQPGVHGRLRHGGELDRQRQARRVAQHGRDRVRVAEREQEPAAHATGGERCIRRARRVDAHAEVVRRERRRAAGDGHRDVALQRVADGRRDLALGLGARRAAERDARDAHAVRDHAALQHQVPDGDRDQGRADAEADQDAAAARAHAALTAIQPRTCSRGIVDAQKIRAPA